MKTSANDKLLHQSDCYGILLFCSCTTYVNHSQYPSTACIDVGMISIKWIHTIKNSLSPAVFFIGLIVSFFIIKYCTYCFLSTTFFFSPYFIKKCVQNATYISWIWFNNNIWRSQFMVKTWCTYNAVGICKVDSKLTHGSNDGQKTLNCIVMHDRTISQALFLGISILMDYPNTQTMPPSSSNIVSFRQGFTCHSTWNRSFPTCL